MDHMLPPPTIDATAWDRYRQSSHSWLESSSGSCLPHRCVSASPRSLKPASARGTHRRSSSDDGQIVDNCDVVHRSHKGIVTGDQFRHLLEHQRHVFRVSAAGIDDELGAPRNVPSAVMLATMIV